MSLSDSAWKHMENASLEFIGDVDVGILVEIGVDWGYSLYHWARSFPNTEIIGVDNFSFADGDKSRDHVEMEIFTHFRDNVTLWVMDSVDAAAKYAVEFPDSPIDVLHIDADHVLASVKQDFAAWEPLVRPGGVIIFHDIISFPEDVGYFFHGLKGMKKSHNSGPGLGAWYKPLMQGDEDD